MSPHREIAPALSIVNGHPSYLEGPQLLHELVAPSSTATAIDFLGHGSKRRKFSYETLHRLSNAFSQKITQRLEKLESTSTIIPVLLPQCPELYIVLLAVLKAGKAFCPLNLDVPVKRLAFILKDISANLLITDSTHVENLEVDSSIVTLDVGPELFQADEYAHRRSSHIRTSDLAYVLYTSGSTGLPKAVSVSHRAVTQSLLAHDRHIPAFSRFLQFAAPTFDVSIFEIFFPWYRGRTLSSRTRTHMLNELPETIRMLNVDAAELTPTVVSNLLEGRQSVPKLKLLLTIGEMLTQDVIAEYGDSDERPGILWAMYGPTEAAIHCTLQPCISVTATPRMIGFPLDTVSAFVAAPVPEGKSASTLLILPVEQEGELVVGGFQVAEEYLNRPKLTAASFMCHPEYGYLYRTGDRAKLRHDGSLECLGRVSIGQVKLKGQRIELGEVEQTIMKTDGCRAAAVLVVDDRLIAFCTTGARKILRADVLEICKRWLPEIMIPSDVILMRNMPQLPSGKIDKTFLVAEYRKELHRNSQMSKGADEDATHPVLDVLKQFLQGDLTLHSNLAFAGLDSLKAIRLASILRVRGYRLTASQILSAITAGDVILAANSTRSTNGVHPPQTSTTTSLTEHGIPELEPWLTKIAYTLPCTPLQEAMLAETVVRPKAYCNWFEVETSELHTFHEIQEALQQLVQDNDILRSGFYPVGTIDGTFIQVVWKDLKATQIRQVGDFSRIYSLGSYESLLRPLSIQIKTTSSKSRLLFQIHHALYDGWSLDLIFQDLDTLLHGSKLTRRPQFREISQYHVNRGADSRSTDESYWTNLLRNRTKTILPNLNGQVVQSRTARSSLGQSAVNLQVLLERSGELAVNPQVFFQAAVAYVTSLYVGSTDIIVGNVTSGRTIPITGVEDIIGPCIASLPFRLRFDTLANVRDILYETQRLNRESLEHCSLPLRDIAKAAGVQAGTRLFDVLFVWQQSLYSATNSASSIRLIESADELEFKITLEFEPRSDHIWNRATYDLSAIPETQIKYLSRQVDEVVQIFLDNLGLETASIARCFTANSTSIANPVPQQRPILQGPAHAVEKWAEDTPDRQAIVFSSINDGVMQVTATATYATLNFRANQLARVLQEQRVCSGDLVGVVMEKSVDLYVAILAVLKVGAGYLPLVPDLPSERMSMILSEAQIVVCISDSTSSTHLRDKITSAVVCIGEVDLSAYPAHNVTAPYVGSHVAYAVFTSGSTGTPKGVLVTQDNLMSNLGYLSTIYPYTTDSRLLQSCSQAFDVSVFEIFFSWHIGICLCTATKDDLFLDLENAINKMGITHLSLTPTVAALINPDNVPKVEFLVTAGEAVTEQVRRKWVGRGLYQGYGPSETTNICTIRPTVSPTDLINNIGPPFNNTSAFVIDPKGTEILPRGAVGELCFGGHQVFRGYLNQPEMTASKIIMHPAYGRIYRSGDLGIMLADDSILFFGRMDDQVKIRGQRVELGEIAAHILKHESILDCVTLLIPGDEGPSRLVSFWVPNMAIPAKFSVLHGRTFRTIILEVFTLLSQHLPSYMVPSHLIPVSQLPMTVQGKIDKRLLQSSLEGVGNENMECAANSDESGGGEIITDPLEIKVGQLLANTLQIPMGSIKRTSSFFNLGLDSVSAIRLSNELRKAGLEDLSISTILKNSTVARLAVLANADSHKQPTSNTCAAVSRTINADEISRIQNMMKEGRTLFSKILPCTPLQEAMLSSGRSSATSYNNVMIFSINGDLSLLQECWASMVRRHETLRTLFVATSDPSFAYAQVVSEDATIAWGELKWSDDTYQQANRKVLDLLDANKPPVWLAVARTEQLTKLLFCCHHAVYDGIAVQTLLKEVQDVYYHRKLPPPVSYDLYLQHLLSRDFKAADDFWRNSFRGFEPTFFPDLTGRAHKEVLESGSHHRRLKLSLSEVRAACQSASVSLLSVIHATWAKLLHFYTGEGDICFGTVVSGRALHGHDLQRLVAPCFNTLPVRLNFNFSNNNAALVHLAHTFNVDSLAFQLTPLRRIQNMTFKDGSRLFDTLVILQQPSEPLDTAIWTLEEDRGEMDLPLVCELFQNQAEDSLEVVLHYHSTILSGVEADIIAQTFNASLASILEHPHAPANDTISLSSDLRAESNLNFSPLETETYLLHSGFEGNARDHPERIALDFLHEDGTRTTWSFQTLSERANGIAHILLDAGTMPEDVVPIHIAKSPIFYASLLGVLKAGAAFAPIHPGLPDARKRLMLEELEAKVILVTNDAPLPENVTITTTLDVGALKCARNDTPVIQGLLDSNLAYCIFTSGSTGIPKAVSMEHRSPIQTVSSSRSLVPWDTSSRLLQYAAITFDMCYYDCFLAWTFGFTLCAAEQQLMLDHLPSTINTLDVDLLDLTPSVAASLLRSEVPGIKWLYCIGEAMMANIAKGWGSTCVNSYGPSETAFCTTIYPVSPDTKTAVFGKPFPSTSFAVFPTDGDRPLPLLSAGELYIGGAQLARGYLGKPKLTDEKFVTKCGQRFYRSGDVVRMLSDGNFEFIGRADDQVKIRGLRVELDEINNVLRASHANVMAVVTVIMKRDTTAKEQLVAFFVTGSPIEDDEREDLRRHLQHAAKERLPSYMVPQFLLFVDRIPRSLAGKVDRNALTGIFHNDMGVGNIPISTSQEGEHYQWTEVESRVRDVFARLSSFSLENISPTTTIYQLGLDSISAVQIATALRRESYNVHASDVMKHLSCVDIAAYIEQGGTTTQPEAMQFDFHAFEETQRPPVMEAYNISDDDVTAIRPCTPLQNGMISQMLAKEGAVYLNYIRLQLNADIHLHRLEHAWKKVMTAHPMLRTGFAHLKDKIQPFGMVEYKPDAVDLPWNTVSKNVSSASCLEELRRRAVSEFHRPLWNLRIIYDNDATYLDLAIFHALFDAQSLQSIFRDVATAYIGHDLGSKQALNPVIDGILQRSDGQNERGEKFWKQIGKEATPCRFPNLAPLRYEPRPPMVRTLRSEKSLLDMEHACRRANTTMQAVGLASWLSLLSGYTGEARVACGVVLSGRNFESAEQADFPCINTVPFLHAVTKRSHEMLTAVTAQVAEVQQFQHISLGNIQKLMGYPNEALFDTIFAYQKLPMSEHDEQPWTIVDEEASIEYPVSIELEPNDKHLEYRLTFMSNIIPQEQANLILEQLDHLMQSFLSPIPELQSFEKSLYSITPAKEPTLPSDVRLLHEFVELSAMNHPHTIALEFAYSIHDGEHSTTRWTYFDLDAEGNRIANLLITSGVQPGSLVGVCFDKCPEASFAMLGVLKAGCAFVAIDPGAPAARQTFIIEDSRAVAVLSMAAQSAGFKSNANVPVVNLDESTTDAFPSSKPSLIRNIGPGDRSYCLYTSGTTGTPKGCELTHENAVQALLSFQRLFAGHWDSKSRWLQFASFHFDVSVLEQYWSWSVGICVVSAPRDVILEDLAKSINTLGITHLDLTPSLAQILHPDEVPSLCKGVFITGGESLKQEILDVWGPKGVIYNGYGPTEATIGCTMYPRVPSNGKPSNIGWQFDNVGTYVLQPSSDVPVLRGGVGELCVSGKLVGKGYLNRDDLTNKSFPFLERFGDRVYCTGDLVRVLYDNTFEFLGRADDQVKLRGQRLEIGEINSIIRQSSESISDVATLVLKHPRQQKEQLVAFVVQGCAKDLPRVVLDKVPELERAKESCHEKLPPYMVPTHFVPLSSLPLNINNKADAKKLKELYEDLSTTDLQNLSNISGGNNQHWSIQESKLRSVVKEELDISEIEVGKDTSFFELGMDSISVIGVAKAMKQAGLLSATASLVMKHSTVRRLAKVLSTGAEAAYTQASLLAAQQTIAAMQYRHRRTVAQSLSVETSNIEALAPCTPLQQGMIARFLESDVGLYFNSFILELNDDVDCSKLQEAWQSVFTQNQILRTVFTDTEDGYVQVVLRNSTLPWISDSPTKTESVDDCQARLMRKWLQSNRGYFTRPFEIISLTTPARQVLVIHMFHALYDGTSIELIFRAVWDAYSGHDDRDTAPSFQSALAYGPLRTQEGAKHFWEDHLSSSTSRPLPVLIHEETNESIKATREIPAMATFEATRRKLNVTAQAVVQACWLVVIQDFVKGAITMGVVVSGRSIDLEGADRIVGPMFNTIPYQHRCQESESWKSIIKTIHDFNTTAHPYQHTPLRDIIRWSKKNSSELLFDNLFVYQVGQDEGEWSNNKAWRLIDGDAAADYPLAFEIEKRPDGAWKLNLVAQSYVANEAMAENLLDNFEKALREAIDHPETLKEATADMEYLGEDGEPTTNGVSHVMDFEWTDNANILREALAHLTNNELDEIHESTSIFALGLDSIDAIKLSSKLRKRGLELPVSGIMRGLTIEKMLPNIKRTTNTEKTPLSSDTVLANRKDELKAHLFTENMDLSQVQDILPPTPLQEAMVAEMVTSEFTRYYNFDVMRLNADTNINQLQNAWTQIVAASPILRTSFVEIDDPNVDASFAQIIHAQPHNFWRQKVVENEPEYHVLFDELRKEAAQLPALEPLFHVTVIRSPDQTYLALSIAHALYDGWSLGLIHADVRRAYEGHFEPRPDYQPTLSAILSSSGADAATYWADCLFEAKSSTFERRMPSFGGTSNVVHRLHQISKTPVADLTEFAKKSSVSLQTIGQAVFAMVLASYIGSLDVTFGSVLSGRDDETASQLLFPTMNTVPIRTIVHGTRSELLRHVQDSFNNTKQWQHFPLRKALALAGAHGGLFESLFIYQKGADMVNEPLDLLYTSIEGRSDVEYPVCVEMEIVHDELIWRCAVKDEVFNESDSRKMMSKLDNVIHEILQSPEKAVIDFTPQGASICGLPPFHHEERENTNSSNTSMDNEQHQTVEPETKIVRAIREVLAAVSGSREDEITEQMTIFHVGLDSISAIKVASLLRRKGIDISVGEMLKAGCIKDMARIIDNRSSHHVDDNQDYTFVIDNALQNLDVNAIMRREKVQEGKARILPITAGQLYMLSMWLNTCGSNFYPEFTYNLTGSIPFETLQSAWKTLVVANPMLRTIIVATQDSQIPYVQLVREDTDGICNVAYHAEEQSTDQQHELEQPWTRLGVTKTNSGWEIKLKIHHALYDGVSLPILMQQLQDLCNGSTAPDISDKFAKYVASAIKPSAFEARKSFWMKYLDSIEQHRLHQPTLSPTSQTEIFMPDLLPIKTVDSTARQHGFSVQTLFLAAYAKLYARLTRAPKECDIVIGIYLANRSLVIPGIETAAIPTINLLPLRVCVPLEKSMVDAAQQIQQHLQKVSEPANASASLWEISEWSGVKVDSFVNFLTLPDAETGQEDNGIKITPASQWNEEVSRVVEHAAGNGASHGKHVGGLRNERVNGAYLHAIDIEATVRNGALGVGIFAPVEMLGLEEGKKMTEDLRLELEAIGK
ncbi:nonribosomal peptide synthetase-like protein 2 [Ophiobolus disseminans]|uniref:Nonribosomal peptide synthetase-like protein 2 n=1 Tax=Ophiobolus disseminans TaxID=1469910 RepID=A0A6A7A652_9PLEO|nr:nonribosomal peptide synthetase-like protein 2 [Ophiobolus disseminans]